MNGRYGAWRSACTDRHSWVAIVSLLPEVREMTPFGADGN